MKLLHFLNEVTFKAQIQHEEYYNVLQEHFFFLSNLYRAFCKFSVWADKKRRVELGLDRNLYPFSNKAFVAPDVINLSLNVITEI